MMYILRVAPRAAPMALFIGLWVGSCPLVGCHNDRSDRANEGDVGPDEESVKQSLEELKPRLRSLDTQFTVLHRRFDALPPTLPGFGEVRAKFYATDEGMGIMGPKITWLSDRLDSALKSSDRDQLRKVSMDIAITHKEMSEIDRIALELSDQVSPFERMARP